MPRPARWSSRQGLLLVEAILSAIVIAVGLALISRGLASSLKALRTVETAETLLDLAHGKLVELEAQRAAGHALSTQRTGTFEEPFEAYAWVLQAAVRDDLAKEDGSGVSASEVTVTVQRTDPSASSVTFSALWPREWVPAEWDNK